MSEPSASVPDALAHRVRELLAGADVEGDAIAWHIAAAEQTVARLLRDQSTSRASALDLLAADALATYAFELAADSPESIPQLAERAMARFAALGASIDADADGAAVAHATERVEVAR